MGSSMREMAATSCVLYGPQHSARGQAFRSFSDLCSPDGQGFGYPSLSKFWQRLKAACFKLISSVSSSWPLYFWRAKKNKEESPSAKSNDNATHKYYRHRLWYMVAPSNVSTSLSCQVRLPSCQNRTSYRHFCLFNSQSTIRCSRQQELKITFPNFIFSSPLRSSSQGKTLKKMKSTKKFAERDLNTVQKEIEIIFPSGFYLF